MAYNNTFKIWAGQGGAVTPSFSVELFRDFEGDKQLNSNNSLFRLGPDLQFSRPTPATFYSSLSTISTIGNNVPRFEYSRSGETFKGLLVEELRTNLVEYSTDFTTSTWVKATSSEGPGVSIQSNVPSVAAPDGTFTVSKMYMNPARGYRSITWVEAPYPEIEGETGDRYARSIYIKKDTARYISIGCDGVTNATNTTNVFDFDNPGFNEGNLFSMFWEYVRDGWYRIGFFRDSSNTNTNKLTIGFSPTRQSTNYIDTLYTDTTISETASSVYIWGAQVEKGWLPTSYIPTSGTQITRAADKIFLLRGDFLTTYNPISSSFFIKGSRTYTYFGTYFSISNLGKNIFINLGANIDPNYTNFLGVSTAELNQNTFIYPTLIDPVTQPQTLAAGIEGNNMVLYQNQQLAALSTSNVSIPIGVNNLYIGSIEGTNTFLNGHILKLHYWPYRLDDSTLQSQT